MNLKVSPAQADDVYRDIIRVPEQYRMDARGRVVPEGSVCRMEVRGRIVRAIVRGEDSPRPVVRIDERLRNMLGLRPDDEVEVHFRREGLLGEFLWAWRASDPAYRVAARLGLLSVALGALGLVLGLLSLFGRP